jgi:hypothetical protein
MSTTKKKKSTEKFIEHEETKVNNKLSQWFGGHSVTFTYKPGSSCEGENTDCAEC